MLLPVANAAATKVIINLAGTGTVAGGTPATPTGIECSNLGGSPGPSCEHDFGAAIEAITLTAAPGPESTFLGWSGPANAGTCSSGSASPCSFTNSFLVPTVTITATFDDEAVAPPEVQIEPVAEADTSASEATFHGSVNPNGSELKACRFEYLTQAKYESNGSNFTGATPLPCDLSPEEIGDEESFVDVEATATGLEPHTTYRVRLLAEKENVAPVSAEAPPFTTASQAPSIERTDALANPTFASLYAEIDPHNEATSYRFEWGLTVQYGDTVPVPNGMILAGSEPKTVVALIEGLAPATTYHFRVVASNAQVSETLDQTFTTPPPPPPRGYELVSSSPKQGADAMASPLVCCGHSAFVNNGLVTGGKAIWTDRGAIPNPDPTNGRQNWYASTRDSVAGSWDIQTLAPAGAPGDAEFKVRAAPDDLSTLVLESRIFEPTQGAQEEKVFWLRRADGGFVPMPPFGGSSPDFQFSPDGGRVFLNTTASLVPEDHHESGAHQVYEWTADRGLRFLGVDEEGNQLSLCGALLAGGGSSAAGLKIPDVSSTGTRVLLQSPDPSFPSGPPPACRFGGSSGNTYVSDLYLREGSMTKNISRPPVGTPNFGARMVGATPDLSKVFFVTESALPDDDPDTPEKTTEGSGHLDLYRYDTASGDLTRLSVAASGGEEDAGVTPIRGGSNANARAAIASADGSTVYFTALGQLTPGEGRTRAENGNQTANLYMWRQGAGLRFIATIAAANLGTVGSTSRTGGESPPLFRRGAAVTPSGSVLVFNTGSRLTGYDNEGAGMLYRYDAASGRIDCITCSPVGTPLLVANSRSPMFRTAFFDGAEANSTSLSQLGGLSADGSTVTFSSSDPLLPAVRNASSDSQFPVYNVFAWHDGALQMISTGTSPSSDELLGTSPNGEDVYFLSAQRLVGRDHDDGYDIYNARVGGGFPEPTPSPSCLGSECRGPAAAPPGVSNPTTDTFVGAGNLKSRANKRRCGKGKVRRGKRCVSKRKLAQRICRKTRGTAKRRCIQRQIRRLSAPEQHRRTATHAQHRRSKAGDRGEK